MRAFLVCAALAALVAGSAASSSRPKPHGNNFYANCKFSHTANDDPIVYPGQPGRSHPHTFFGNTSTNANSTLATLRAAKTTCKPSADKAAYWVPTLYQNGREVRPVKGQFYNVVRGYDQMHPFPAGLKMVAGDAHAFRPQSVSVTYWTCGASGGERSTRLRTIPKSCANVPLDTKTTAFFKACPTCPEQPAPRPAHVKTFLELHVIFPDCWDGKHLDSPDHKSHMAYSRQYVCPASHPVKVPQIKLMVHYPITSGQGVTLASGSPLTGHADFFNAWDERALTKLVNDCFHGRPCNEPKSR